MNMKKLFLLVSILFTTTYLSYGQTGTGSNTVNSSNPEYSTALGTGNTSTGYYSFIGGSNSEATGSHSFGFGQYVQSTADFAFIFGKGKDDNTGTLDFINNTPNSFMIGFNTTTPSFFVESFHIKGGGFVGIHTTSPTSELDVNGVITTLGFRMPQLGVLDGYVLTYDAEEDKAVWAQPIGGTQGGDGYWTSNGEHIHFVSANGPLGNGNVGIGPASSYRS